MKKFNFIGKEEINAVTKVMKSGILSDFIGVSGDKFNGGKKVKELEKKWSNYFNVKYSVSVNSNTTGLMCALGAIGLEPGDEVITSPWSMVASATSILVWNAIPIFADIELDTFNIDPNKIEKLINKKTKALVVTSIYGHPANIYKIKKIAKKYNLKIIEDVAQSPGAKIDKKFAGTIGDIGVFSLNFNKHIHTGEGGICVTNNKFLDYKMRMIRNHGEACLKSSKKKFLINNIGYNFRLTEIQAAIGIEQLKKLKNIAKITKNFSQYLIDNLKNFKFLRVPIIKKSYTHVFYSFPLLLDKEVSSLQRKKIIESLNKKRVIIGTGSKNIHLFPMYQKKIAYGSNGFPWNLNKKNYTYKKGICPNAESLQENRIMTIPSTGVKIWNKKDMTKIISSFKKTWQEIFKQKFE